ncbi:MAG: amino acid permease [Clostridia bacterium]|nr:amino acid permease [Clostridia bacterium]
MSSNIKSKDKKVYLTALGAWALAFGCAVGQGAFLMPGGTFLPSAGPIGTAIGIALGTLIMVVLARNYHLLMNRYPDSGGTYTYTKKCFGYDHGFLSAWFLILCYIAILWANAIGLPFVLRSFVGSTFQFGFDYEIAGFHVWFGEILIVFAVLITGALICLRRKLAESVMIIMGVLLLTGISVCFIAALLGRDNNTPAFEPAFSSDNAPIIGIFTIFALAPWAFAGFESVSHSAEEAKFPLKKTFRILVIALITSGAAYIILALLSSMAQPEGAANWQEYVSGLGSTYSEGVTRHPPFFVANAFLGRFGRYLMCFAAAFGIFTGVIGNYIALSRLIHKMSEDRMIPEWIGKTDKRNVPRNAILCTLAISTVIPFFGRSAISWIVDATTVGATIAYAFTSASALKTAREERSRSGIVTGVAGLVISLFFALAFLIPNLISVQTLQTESYLILATWCFIGYLVFLYMLKKDKERRLGRSNVALIVMLGVIIFTSTVWMRQYSSNAVDNAVEPIKSYYSEHEVNAAESEAYLTEIMDKADNATHIASVVQVSVIVLTIITLFTIYAIIQKREKQIEVEKALAEETSRAKTSFLSNMSHEIRTPMNAIIGLDNIALRDPDLTPRTREHLEKIGASAKHLLGLINDILDMSRIESGRMVLKSEEFLMRELIDQVNIIINGQCLDKGLHYECNIVGSLSDYYIGDDMKLKQLLINILGNSVKFTEAPGEVSLTVEETNTEDGECRLKFIMRDTGIGMDKEYIPKIFEAFSQEDATTTNKYGGSGLGMAITKNFVDMMGGNIDVQSEKGVGSVFTVTVKLERSQRKYIAESALSIPEGLRAAVIDDDEIACEHAVVVLNGLNIEADAFTSPKEALEAISKAYKENKPYRLVLTDYKMPDMNGLEFTKKLREFDSGETAVILLTGYNWDIISDEARREDGVDEIIAKPLFSDSLLRTVNAVLDLKGDNEAEEIPEESEESLLAGKRILMAEDVDANAEILADLLDLEDIVSERAENGQIAVEMFSSHPAGYYDAILMDVRMPVMDGLTATENIRALEREDAKTIPIIAMTANVFDEDVERSHKAGMNAHLSKPIEPEKMYHTLAHLIAENEQK